MPTAGSVLELDDNEAATSLCLLRFSNWPDEGLVLAVGTVQGLTFYPRQVDGGLLHDRPDVQDVPCIALSQLECSVISFCLQLLKGMNLRTSC